MRAVTIEHRGETGEVRDLPIPDPGPHDVLVRVTAASVNPIDWKTRDRGERPMPFVLGQDFAGVVSAVGAEVSRYAQGERVFGVARDHGAFAEFTTVPEESHEQPIAHIPDDVGDADAAALPTAGLTALGCLEATQVGNGTTVAILGATGGVGGFAAQIARSRGARVIGTGHSGSEELARSFGVDDFIAYDKGEDIPAALRRIAPAGVDAILDLVDPAENTAKMADALRAGGAIVSTIGALDIAWFEARGFSAKNLVMTQTPQSSREGLRDIARMVEDGTLRVLIVREFELRDAARALEESKDGNTNGKIVITLSGAG